MAATKSKRGGARKGAGRKPKVVEKNLHDLLADACPDEHVITIFRVMTAQAQAGDTKAAALLLGYKFGKPIERQEITGANGEGIKIVVEYADHQTDPS